jgi:2-phosphosulfolactate phosphatase
MPSGKKAIEVCFSPVVYHRYHNPDFNVVVTDILRASSAICTAFMNGAERIIPVGSLEEAKLLKEHGYLIAAERDGITCDFADFGNSPNNFSKKNVLNKTIVYSTTNGTQAIQKAKNCHQLTIGSYLNINALAEWLASEQRNVLILCAGWKERFSLEDTVFAGALSQLLIDTGLFHTACDSTLAACDLWSIARKDLLAYIQKASHINRLKKFVPADIINYCHTFNMTNAIPIFKDNYLIEINNCEKSNNFLKK